MKHQASEYIEEDLKYIMLLFDAVCCLFEVKRRDDGMVRLEDLNL